MKNRLNLVIVTSLIFLFSLAGLYFYFFLQKNPDYGNDKEERIKINGTEFIIEISETQEKLAKGLSGRDGLCENCGMVFKFSEKGNWSFWMKGMRFDLDIIWIEGDEVVYMAKYVPYDSQETITPDVKADKVLEINSGKSDQLGLKPGDRIIFEN